VFIVTWTGVHFEPLNPKPDDIRIADIAHALARTCRFNGHGRTFYSVAQHSILGSERLDRNLARAFLIHDAGEAYLCDLGRRVKGAFPDLVAAERRIMEQVAAKFRVPWPMPDDVWAMDDAMGLWEALELFPDEPTSTWAGHDFLADGGGPSVLSPPPMRHFVGWSPGQAEGQFLDRFDQLWSARERSIVGGR